MRDLDPLVWFGKREVEVVPKHFVRTTSPETRDSKNWVITSLKGRYGTIRINHTLSWGSYFCFEDPAEAMMYELRWSGN